MKIREIRVGELPGFIGSDDYAKLNPRPITPLRAMSQFNNPHARKEDVALIYAAEDNTLIAFAGLLPHAVASISEPVFSNSGWWVHPAMGRQMGLPLFLKALQRSNQRMFFTDSPRYTKDILEKTGLFTYFPPKIGTRFFLRFYLGKWIKRKNPGLSPVFSLTDGILNAVCALRFPFLLKRKMPEKYSVRSMSQLTGEYEEFIEKHAGGAYLKQDRQKLNWIVSHPWISTGASESVASYPFSFRADFFKQEFLSIRKDDEIKALLLLSVRDHHASLPFIYAEKESLPEIARIIWSRLVNERACSLIVFHQDLGEALKKTGHFWLFKKNIIRFSGYSKQLHSIFGGGGDFQDGDGDAAFT